MKRYIKPNTDITTVELQSMIAATATETIQNQGNLGGDTSGFTFGGKEYDFFTEEETAEKNEYGVYSLWED